MFSRCPHCDRQQPVSTQQLRETRGLLTCVACRRAFDALPSLSDEAGERINPIAAAPIDLPEHDRPNAQWPWLVGNAWLLLVLILQFVYFKAGPSWQQSYLYADLVALSARFGLNLPAYRNPSAWSVSHTELKPYLASGYKLSAVLTNQAAVNQALPDLKLAVTDLTGRTVAERIFPAGQFGGNALWTPQQSLHIQLALVIPAIEPAGFSLTPI
ncbi:zinc-ribbon and DUF3426 domain-containing protein [Methylomonas sp. HYX-M1]|uniref:zinc-ribbon and DUF3426 domain-containing protein n=1 Tax=Methylomonas sp. HYX-M1 TaxID=3139307 RepID=UPI00345BEEF1